MVHVASLYVVNWYPSRELMTALWDTYNVAAVMVWGLCGDQVEPGWIGKLIEVVNLSPDFSWIALPSFVCTVDKSCTTSPQAYVPAHMMKHIKKVL